MKHPDIAGGLQLRQNIMYVNVKGARHIDCITASVIGTIEADSNCFCISENPPVSIMCSRDLAGIFLI